MHSSVKLRQAVALEMRRALDDCVAVDVQLGSSIRRAGQVRALGVLCLFIYKRALQVGTYVQVTFTQPQNAPKSLCLLSSANCMFPRMYAPCPKSIKAEHATRAVAGMNAIQRVEYQMGEMPPRRRSCD
jgi:hypothetical protein